MAVVKQKLATVTPVGSVGAMVGRAKAGWTGLAPAWYLICCCSRPRRSCRIDQGFRCDHRGWVRGRVWENFASISDWEDATPPILRYDEEDGGGRRPTALHQFPRAESAIPCSIIA